MNGTAAHEDDTQRDPPHTLDMSDGEEDDAQDDDHPGDYSARFDELMSDGEHGEHDEDEVFVYTEDPDSTGNYREQLRDVLGPDDEEDELSEKEVEHVLEDIRDKETFAAAMDDEAVVHVEAATDSSPVSTSPTGEFSPPPMTPFTPPRSRPLLHPMISRLRSTTPQPSPRLSSAASAGTVHSHGEGMSAPPSHFSALSPMSSTTNLHAEVHAAKENGTRTPAADREVFRWTQLGTIGEHMYVRESQKLSAVLGSPSLGSPTVLAANGLICVGTDAGRIAVFDFKQKLQCICGESGADRTVGAVTALALSFDHTFVASGHATGYIQLFELRNAKTAARVVAPTSLGAVASGRQEGHLAGSRIVSVGFVAGRHTALVSADDGGLAFYHSLGKVFFVEASDILRILGTYPDAESAVVPSHQHFRRRKLRKTGTVLAMGPLPLGTSQHPTDGYSLVALLTPAKLVIVGLKPTPKTWYRRHRESDDDGASKSRYKGTLAWFPSVIAGAADSEKHSKKDGSKVTDHRLMSTPTLVYSWGDTVHLMRVSETKIKQQVRNPKTGKVSEIEVGRLVFEEAGKWIVEGDVLAVQWLNVNQVLIVTAASLEVFDIRLSKVVERVSFDAWSLVSPILSHTTTGAISYSDAVTEVAHSVRVYKGKIFLLGQREVQVGTLLTWADRILSFVQNGDFLNAIDLTRSYFLGEALGNRNGLPEDAEELKDVVGEKMHELMVASAHYAFAEERMYDSTHAAPDGRGVDRTSLFENLVVTCTRACMALDDFEFLFEVLFQYYDNNGISRIFLTQLEPFILDGGIRHVPPRVTQRLIAMHAEDSRPDLAERVIWHIDPDCLDINQAITLCQHYHLYDALIYVFTRALQDYVSPVVELIGLVRAVQQFRRTRAEASPTSASYVSEETIEPVIINAYKIYPYLANVLTGLTYPSDEPLTEEEAVQAKNDVYTFLFFGTSHVWPLGEGGRFVLTSDEENGMEPTYPYVRLLLRFDAEAFLNMLDLAFEDGYLNDETRGVSRLIIVKILLEILSSPGLSSNEVTFINIFLARNIPKYPQYILDHMQATSDDLRNILISLAEDTDDNTREDRELAAECLLSAYTRHDNDRMVRLFEEAGFFRILRSWHRQEHQWVPLFLTYLEDPALPSMEVFPSLDDVLDTATRTNKGTLPGNLLNTVVKSLPALLKASVTRTALLIDKRSPALHEQALELLGPDADRDRFAYLRYLLGSPHTGEDEYMLEPPRPGGPSTRIVPSLRQMYLSLYCQFDPSGVIPALKYLPPNFLDLSRAMHTCEELEVFDAVIWALNEQGNPQAALAKAEMFEKRLSSRLADSITSISSDSQSDIGHQLLVLEDIGRVTVAACLEHSQANSANAPLEEIWFRLLRSQIDCVQRVASCCSSEALTTDTTDSPHVELERRTLSILRTLVQTSFSSLMSISSTKAVSFPRLFKRLVDSASDNHASKGTLYTEFRTILTGMLESYRSEGDMLVITKHLVDRDLFVTVEQLATERLRGWAPTQTTCSYCREHFLDSKRSTATTDAEVRSSDPIIVSRTGAIYHSACLPPDSHANSINVQ